MFDDLSEKIISGDYFPIILTKNKVSVKIQDFSMNLLDQSYSSEWFNTLSLAM